MKYTRDNKEEMEEMKEDYGTINLSYDELPEAMNWKDGETYELTVRQVSSSKKGVELEVLEAGSESEVEDEEYNEE